ncbi:MAG: hypothetical protein ABIQ52_14865 [Vicinamibacterales bacterium]
MLCVSKAMLRQAALIVLTTLTAIPLLEAQSQRAADKQDRRDPAAVVYVETNSPDGNAVLAFNRDPRGRLSLMGTYPTGGTGVFDASLKLGPFDSDQNLIANPERTHLFAVNSGSNSIAVFDIANNGALTPVAGSPFPSGGTNPVSIGLARDVLAVVNKGMDPAQPAGAANYAAFRVTPRGQLTALLSTETIDPAVSATQALISPSKQLVFGADFLGGLLRSFLVLPDGALLQTGLVAPPAFQANGTTAAALPLGLAAHPAQPLVYVGFVTVNRIGLYTYDERGHLTFIHSVADSGAAVCWLVTNAAGTRLYASNTGDNSISVYDTSSPFNPVEIQHLVLTGSGSAFQIALDPVEAYLYVVTQRATVETPLGEGNNLHVLSINEATGRLSQNAHSITRLDVQPLGTRPQGVVAMQPR